jgi:hypothetical protein
MSNKILKTTLDLIDPSRLKGSDKKVFEVMQEVVEQRILSDVILNYIVPKKLFGLIVMGRLESNNTAIIVRASREKDIFYGSVYGVGAPYYFNPIISDPETREVIANTNEKFSLLSREGDGKLMGLAHIYGIVLPGIEINGVAKSKDLLSRIEEINNFYYKLNETIGKYNLPAEQQHKEDDF